AIDESVDGVPNGAPAAPVRAGRGVRRPGPFSLVHGIAPSGAPFTSFDAWEAPTSRRGAADPGEAGRRLGPAVGRRAAAGRARSFLALEPGAVLPRVQYRAY